MQHNLCLFDIKKPFHQLKGLFVYIRISDLDAGFSELPVSKFGLCILIFNGLPKSPCYQNAGVFGFIYLIKRKEANLCNPFRFYRFPYRWTRGGQETICHRNAQFVDNLRFSATFAAPLKPDFRNYRSNPIRTD